jgi:Holliday junction resolvase RusA-like endonuclease
VEELSVNGQRHDIYAQVPQRYLTEFIVHGVPGPQGSKTPTGQMRRTKTGGLTPVMRESSAKVKPWRQAVAAAAEVCVLGHPNRAWFPLDGPLVVRMVFTMPKPKSAPRTRRTWPMRYPDLSKLARSTEDALTGIIWADDGRIVSYDRLSKVFPGEDSESMPETGVRIAVRYDTGYVSPSHSAMILE